MLEICGLMEGSSLLPALTFMYYFIIVFSGIISKRQNHVIYVLVLFLDVFEYQNIFRF